MSKSLLNSRLFLGKAFPQSGLVNSFSLEAERVVQSLHRLGSAGTHHFQEIIQIHWVCWSGFSTHCQQDRMQRACTEGQQLSDTGTQDDMHWFVNGLFHFNIMKHVWEKLQRRGDRGYIIFDDFLYEEITLQFAETRKQTNKKDVLLSMSLILFTEWPNYRMGKFGKDHTGSSGPAFLLKLGHLRAHCTELCPESFWIFPLVRETSQPLRNKLLLRAEK